MQIGYFSTPYNVGVLKQNLLSSVFLKKANICSASQLYVHAFYMGQGTWTVEESNKLSC